MEKRGWVGGELEMDQVRWRGGRKGGRKGVGQAEGMLD
jgi:hypothetical protein